MSMEKIYEGIGRDICTGYFTAQDLSFKAFSPICIEK